MFSRISLRQTSLMTLVSVILFLSLFALPCNASDYDCQGKVSQIIIDSSGNLKAKFSFNTVNTQSVTICSLVSEPNNDNYASYGNTYPMADTNTCKFWMAQLMAAKAANDNVIMTVSRNNSTPDCNSISVATGYGSTIVSRIIWTSTR